MFARCANILQENSVLNDLFAFLQLILECKNNTYILKYANSFAAKSFIVFRGKQDPKLKK